MEIIKDLAAAQFNKNCYGTSNQKKFLVIHQTGNWQVKANADMHALLQKSGYDASWHWQVDELKAIQSFEHYIQCWHASDGRGNGNLNGIAIEMCINSDGDYVQTVKNGSKLSAKILKEEGIPIGNMKQHYDFARDKKNCPQQIREGKDGINWNVFVQMVQRELDQLNDVKRPTVVPAEKGGVIKMSGFFEVNDDIFVYGTPKVDYPNGVVAKYKKGEELKYDSGVIKNGYVWLHYKSLPDKKPRYIPVAPVNEIWGRFK